MGRITRLRGGRNSQIRRVVVSVSDAGTIALPLVDNTQDMAALAEQLRPVLAAQNPLIPAFYIRGHGLYAWGPDMAAAEAMVEACEFLLACAWEEWKAQGPQR